MSKITGSKITPFLWYDNNAHEAAQFYCSLFKNSKILSTMPGGPDGKPLIVDFMLDGMHVIAMNGGPVQKLSEAFSFYIECTDQAEVDYFWDAFIKNGGTEIQCGWLKDSFGLCWQVVPAEFMNYVNGPDEAGRKRAFDAMLKMVKLDLATIKKAYEGK